MFIRLSYVMQQTCIKHPDSKNVYCKLQKIMNWIRLLSQSDHAVLINLLIISCCVNAYEFYFACAISGSLTSFFII